MIFQCKSVFAIIAASLLSGCSTVAPAPADPVAPMQQPVKQAPTPAFSPVRALVQQQIALLKISTPTMRMTPGGYDLLSLKSGEVYPAKTLFDIGLPALPLLVESLSDSSDTTVIQSDRGALRDKPKVVKTNELVANIIHQISQHEFAIGKYPNENILNYGINKDSKSIVEFQKLVLSWYKVNSEKTLEERKMADVDDPWFGNRRDAVEWLGQHKVMRARPIIARHLENALANPEKEKFLDWEAAQSALALGKLGDPASLPVVKRACEFLATRWQKYGVVGSMDIQTLFEAYQGRALLGEKSQALRELKELRNQVPRTLESSSAGEYQRRLKEAAHW